WPAWTCPRWDALRSPRSRSGRGCSFFLLGGRHGQAELRWLAAAAGGLGDRPERLDGGDRLAGGQLLGGPAAAARGGDAHIEPVDAALDVEQLAVRGAMRGQDLIARQLQ